MRTGIFDKYSTTYDNYLYAPQNFGAGEEVLNGLEPLPFYDMMLKLLENEGLEARYLHEGGWRTERSWYASMAPEYKIYSEAVDLLASTRIDIDAKYLKLPYETFTIRFPRHYLREHAGAPYVKGCIITTLMEVPMSINSPIRSFQVGNATQAKLFFPPPNLPKVRKLIVSCNFDANDKPIEDSVGSASALSAYCYLKLAIPDGKTIEQSFQDMPLHKPDDGYWPSRDFFKRLVTIAISVAFFGVGYTREKKGIVTEDRPNRRERRAQEKATGVKGTPKPSYAVGRDIMLPRPVPGASPKEEPDEDDPDGERHLNFAHIRCGHLHWYARGPRTGPNDYILRWVDPTIIRADLPFKPSGKATPHAIHKPEGEIVTGNFENLEE